MKFLKKMKRYLFSTNSLTRSIYVLYVKKRIVKLKPDEVGLICGFNLGETWLFCSMLDSFMAKQNVQKVVLISNRKYHADIYELFNDKINRCCVDSRIDLKAFRFFREIKKGNFYFLYDYDDWNYASLVESKMTNLQRLKKSVGLDTDTAIRYPQIKDADRATAKELFTRLGLSQGKTVLVSPEAKSCPTLDKAYCQKLCDAFQGKGYDVFLNITSPDNNIQSAKSAFLPLSVASSFCDLCGFVVAVRSGFCEIISGSMAQCHILYPDATYRKVFPAKEFMDSHRTWEYVVNELSQDEVVDLIMKKFEKNYACLSGQGCSASDLFAEG